MGRFISIEYRLYYIALISKHATFKVFYKNEIKISNQARQNFVAIDSQGQIIGFSSLSHYSHTGCKYFVGQARNDLRRVFLINTNASCGTEWRNSLRIP